MHLEIVKGKKPTEKDHLVIITSGPHKLKDADFSPAELDYINRELKDGGKSRIVAINQYKRWVFVVTADPKRDRAGQMEQFRRAGASVAALANRSKINALLLINTGKDPAQLACLAEGMALGSYRFFKYKKEEKGPGSLQKIAIAGLTDREISQVGIICEATLKARDLVNEYPAYLTARQLAREFEAMGKEAGFAVEVFDRKKIESLKMGGLMAVNRGSIEPPTFTIMEWKPRNARNKKPFVLVGKGVVFDTGGLSLKPTLNSMDYMKSDMAGAAAVGGALYAIAKSRLPVHVIALVPATDNRPGENAYVPGDIVKMHSGITVEVLNTDAEGRLILGDALSYAKKYDPLLVIDLATLTGAAAAAIGEFGIVMMGNARRDMKDRLIRSGNTVHERLAEFPFWEEYDDLIKSDVAEIKNVGGPLAGAITAGKFLARFTDYPWIHLDIAGPAFLKSGDSYRNKGGSGVGVRLLFDFFRNLTR